MALQINEGYYKSNRSSSGDEWYTPFYAVEPLLKYVPKHYKIWCPFDDETSAFVRVFKSHGYKVIRSHISEGRDFFNVEPKIYDIIISNPPFSKKDKVIERLYKLGKPFMILLPLNSLQGKKRYLSFKNGIQVLAFNERISFFANDDLENITLGNSFATAYFCRNILPSNLILEELKPDNRSLLSDYL